MCFGTVLSLTLNEDYVKSSIFFYRSSKTVLFFKSQQLRVFFRSICRMTASIVFLSNFKNCTFFVKSQTTQRLKKIKTQHSECFCNYAQYILFGGHYFVQLNHVKMQMVSVKKRHKRLCHQLDLKNVCRHLKNACLHLKNVRLYLIKVFCHQYSDN